MIKLSLVGSLDFVSSERVFVIGSPSGEPWFHFAGSGENVPDIAKSRDASIGRKQNSSLFKATSCHFSVEVFPQIANLQTVGHRSALLTGIIGLISILQQGFIAKGI